MKRASEWVVTTKLGASDRRPGTAAPLAPARTCRFYAGEMAMSIFVLTAALYGMISMQRLTFSFFLTLQGDANACHKLSLDSRCVLMCISRMCSAGDTCFHTAELQSKIHCIRNRLIRALHGS